MFAADYQTDDQKILFIMSYIRGSDRVDQWKENYYAKYTDPTTRAFALPPLAQFSAEFDTMFEPIKEKQKTNDKLFDLKQDKKKINDFNIEFDNLSSSSPSGSLHFELIEVSPHRHDIRDGDRTTSDPPRSLPTYIKDNPVGPFGGDRWWKADDGGDPLWLAGWGPFARPCRSNLLVCRMTSRRGVAPGCFTYPLRSVVLAQDVGYRCVRWRPFVVVFTPSGSHGNAPA
ncbi:hypothetical protein WOLCODRAFT_148549 [Wolfiporia cocos MD-104 SS10]|uniref:Uncharacterized protein n=1 Tax=Wolfiporia cocos (strain MD-104) TaxID=742152 RepID=A0A2H3IYJ0_WOLCO|nr:hypothetical protein WOLCODRAFT_148549 [Wolfiporia cocos MD-104 SS10]